MWKETGEGKNSFLENRFEFRNVQTLLIKNHFLSMKEAILLVPNHLGIKPLQLVWAMSTFQTAALC
jgi:hypothetical protein